jgi:hypothetical protein
MTVAVYSNHFGRLGWAAIDPGVRPVVKALRALGLDTSQSCSGMPADHPDPPDHVRTWVTWAQIRHDVPAGGVSAVGGVNWFERDRALSARILDVLIGTGATMTHVWAEIAGKHYLCSGLHVQRVAADDDAVNEAMGEAWKTVYERLRGEFGIETATLGSYRSAQELR